MNVPLTDDLRQQYQKLFDTCLISPAHAKEIEKTTDQIAAGQDRYTKVGKPLNVGVQRR